MRAPSLSKRLPAVTECLNCAAPVTTAFCPNCGQEAVQHTASVGQLLADVADNIFNLDSKLLRSLHALLFKPGLLTVAYNSGKRARYISPLRLYLTCSVAFFLIFAWSQSRNITAIGDVGRGQKSARAKSESAAGQTGASLSSKAGARNDAPGKLDAATTNTPASPAPDSKGGIHVTSGLSRVDSLDSLPDTVDGFKKLSKSGDKLDGFGLHTIKQLIKLKRIGLDGVLSKFLANVPGMMFLLLPLFAVTLKMLYIRSKALYVEHLIFLLHVHAFAYIVLAVLQPLPANKILAWAPSIIPVYIFLALHTVHGQPRWKTGIKLAMLSVGYFMILGVCLVGTFVITFLTI